MLSTTASKASKVGCASCSAGRYTTGTSVAYCAEQKSFYKYKQNNNCVMRKHTQMHIEAVQRHVSSPLGGFTTKGSIRESAIYRQDIENNEEYILTKAEGFLNKSSRFSPTGGSRPQGPIMCIGIGESTRFGSASKVSRQNQKSVVR